MIQANISSFIGQDNEAEHYYCHIDAVDGKIPPKQYNGSSFSDDEIDTELTEAEAVRLNKKDSFGGYRHKAGNRTTRFESINRVHQELLKRFPDQDIVSYEECLPFSKMICIIDGVDHGVKYFAGTFSHVPRSCYKDLVPDTYKIRCHFCHKEYQPDEVFEEIDWRGRPLIQFMKKRDVDDPCNCFELEWDVIL